MNINIKNIHNSKTVHGIIMGIGISILILGIFKLGQASGYRKARFSEKFGDNYSRNFVDPKEGGFLRDFSDKRGYPAPNGAVGKIVGITLPNIVVAGPDNIEKTILINKNTEIRKYRDAITKEELKVGDFVVVLGSPSEDGQVEAKLIRTLPPPPEKLPNNKKLSN